jgi:hypothetical protein
MSFSILLKENLNTYFVAYSKRFARPLKNFQFFEILKLYIALYKMLSLKHKIKLSD